MPASTAGFTGAPLGDIVAQTVRLPVELHEKLKQAAVAKSPQHQRRDRGEAGEVAMKLTTVQLNHVLSVWNERIPVGSIWRHYKGGLYCVLGHALDTERETINVIYRRLAGPDYDAVAEARVKYARPASEWNDVVGENKPQDLRFTRLQ